MATTTLKNHDDEIHTMEQSHSIIGIANGFSGEFRADGILRIDGDFRGTIRGRGSVFIGKRGRIIGDIYARSISIGGRIKGNVYALEKVEILSSGKLIGNLNSPKFFAEEGMIFSGKGKTVNNDEIQKIFQDNVDNLEPIINEDI